MRGHVSLIAKALLTNQACKGRVLLQMNGGGLLSCASYDDFNFYQTTVFPLIIVDHHIWKTESCKKTTLSKQTDLTLQIGF